MIVGLCPKKKSDRWGQNKKSDFFCHQKHSLIFCFSEATEATSEFILHVIEVYSISLLRKHTGTYVHIHAQNIIHAFQAFESLNIFFFLTEITHDQIILKSTGILDWDSNTYV